MKHFRWALIICICLCSTLALGDSINFTDAFSGDFYNFASAQLTFHGITLTGYYWNGKTWTTQGVTLIGRNEPASQSIDHGIGICVAQGVNGNEDCNDGDQNEISNQKYQEILQISKAPGTLPWTTLGLSSLDLNGNDKPIEHGQLYSSNLNPYDTSFPSDVLVNGARVSFICEFLDGGIVPGTTPKGTCTSAGGGTPPNSEEPDLSFGPDSDSFLYLQAFNSIEGKNNNDFLLRSIGDPSTQVPEPGSIALLATGLAAASLSIKRKFRG
jgi:hypothetical protein